MSNFVWICVSLFFLLFSPPFFCWQFVWWFRVHSKSARQVLAVPVLTESCQLFCYFKKKKSAVRVHWLTGSSFKQKQCGHLPFKLHLSTRSCEGTYSVTVSVKWFSFLWFMKLEYFPMIYLLWMLPYEDNQRPTTHKQPTNKYALILTGCQLVLLQY